MSDDKTIQRLANEREELKAEIRHLRPYKDAFHELNQYVETAFKCEDLMASELAMWGVFSRAIAASIEKALKARGAVP